MPPVPKLEEYRAPWETEAGEDAEIDKGKLKKYIHGLLSDKDRLQTQVTTVTGERDKLKTAADEKAREGETETQRLERENQELKAKLENPAESEEVLRLRVALDKGLTAHQAKRLVGKTEEELAADADELLKEFGGTGSTDGDEGVPRSQPRKLTNPGDPDPDADAVIDIEKALESIPRIN